MSLLRVIGIGNTDRGDDGVGLVAAERLRALLPGSVRVHQHARDGASLISLWEPQDDVVLIDAVMSGAAPGTVHERDLIVSPLPDDISAVTTHSLGVREGVELARALGRLPASLRFIGIEGKDFSVGHDLSDPVRHALDEVIRVIVSRQSSVDGRRS